LLPWRTFATLQDALIVLFLDSVWWGELLVGKTLVTNDPGAWGGIWVFGGYD
jgi:hypothetical protein